MQFRPYGDTGRVLSCLGVAISSNIKTQHQYNSILNRAFERGINYIQYDYRVFKKSLNLKQGLDQIQQGTQIDIGIVVPANILKIRKILKLVINELEVSSIDFLVIQGGISDKILIERFLTFLKKDNRVRHVVCTISDGNRDIDKLELTEGLDGLNFKGDAVLKALNRDYTYNSHKGTTVHNIFSGDKYKAVNSLIFIEKALSISDINIVMHKFINAREVDFVIDFIEKGESSEKRTLTDDDILKHVQEVEYYEVLKGQKSLGKKIKSIFRKKRILLHDK